MSTRHVVALIGAVALLTSACSTGLEATERNPKARTDSVFSSIGDGEPGCAAVVEKRGALLYAAGHGVADATRGIPITADTRFEIGSVSEQFTAAAVYLLAADGRVRLDEDIHTYVSELPDYGTTVTLNELLHNSAGLPSYVSALLKTHSRHDVTTTGDALRVLAARPHLRFPPGSKHAYSSSGYFLLGLVVARASGMSYRQFLDHRLFRPLGMSRSLVRDRHDEPIADLALGYGHTAQGRFPLDMSDWEQVGEGGVVTTARDLATWVANLSSWTVGGTALRRAMLATRRLTDGEKASGGGLDIDRSDGLQVSRSGSWAGYGAAVDVFPDDGLGVALLCNRKDAAVGTQDWPNEIISIWS